MHVWLSQTMTWLYTQTQSLPPRVESHVVCDTTANLDQFPFGNITSTDHDSRAWRMLKARAWPIARRRNAYMLRRKIRQVDAAILHSHFGDRGWRNIADARRTRIRHVVSFYGYDVGRLPASDPAWLARYADLFDTADLFLCEGPHFGRCLQAIGCPEHKIRIHHLGIDTARLPFRPRRWQPGDTLHVLIAGAFTEKKGIPYAIDALSRIKDRVALQLTIVGDASAQQRHLHEKATIMAALQRGGLLDKTKLLGMQPHATLTALAAQNHVFVSPSVTASDGDTEGGAPVSIIEMAASGMPVVSTRHCDIPEVLQDGVSGLLADERDVDGLEQQLVWLLDNPDAWEPMVTSARRHIEANFCASTQAQQLAHHYDALATGRH